MKTTFRNLTQLVAISAVILFQSCGEDEAVVNTPKVTTVNATEITFSSAKLGGDITSTGGAGVIAKGIVFATTPEPTVVTSDTTNQGEGAEAFSVTLTELLPNTTYYARAYATNKAGTNYGQELSFITQTGAPVVSLAISNISYKEALATFSIDDIGASAITGNGFVYSEENTVPTIMDIMWPSNTPELTAEKLIEGLTPGKKYYFRAYANNSQGSSYSNVVEITTLAYPQATDVDGNVYESVMIGDQFWMTENLRVTKFNNGDAIPTTLVNQNISAETNPIYQWAPNGNDANIVNFGRLYTSYVVTDSRKVCPTGWHVPTKAEFSTLMAAVSNHGNKLKTAGTTEWMHNNGTNTLQYDGVGAGVRFGTGTFSSFKIYSETWAATEYNATEHNTFMLYSEFNVIDQYWRDKSNGLSIRCLKD